MTTTTDMEALAEDLAFVVRRCADNGLCPATGGNFSARIDAESFWITASGIDKAGASKADLIRMDTDGRPLTEGRPSAETEVHRSLYALDPGIGAVLHGHSVANTVLSRRNRSTLIVEGYEMAKTLHGVTSHEARLALPILANSQDMSRLAAALRERHAEAAMPYAFLVRGHGIYAWGADLAEARRHLEGWEFLLACELARLQIEGTP